MQENSKLRHVEKDVLIPQIMRDRAKELCSDKVQGNCDKCISSAGNKAIPQNKAFTKCCQETGILMVVKCRQENTALKDCLVGYYSDPSFYEECKAEYLKQREEYRATGIKKKRQKFTPNKLCAAGEGNPQCSDKDCKGGMEWNVEWNKAQVNLQKEFSFSVSFSRFLISSYAVTSAKCEATDSSPVYDGTGISLSLLLERFDFIMSKQNSLSHTHTYLSSCYCGCSSFHTAKVHRPNALPESP
ncbi:hypothetical protein IHE44_0000404 [Lamprotornis superbus]|uniref:COX assembly mitochondrial protein n=1 Tax=Lamprotornis superbus TaxID=245042 RepID=A0A835NWU3_9PASS|nr:hypothetical protein IHE44_0000404 [Lamprotornis superbus]